MKYLTTKIIFSTLLSTVALTNTLYAKDMSKPTKTIECEFLKTSKGYSGSCFIPSKVNAISIKSIGKKFSNDIPKREVAAAVIKKDYGWTGTMVGKKPEDPRLFEIINNKNGKASYGKLPFGWYYIKDFKLTNKSMKIVFDASHLTLPTKVDLRIVQRAKDILSKESLWNKNDTRKCPSNAETLSIFCAMLQAGGEITGKVHYRQPAMQAFRKVLNKIGKDRINKHRIQDWNNHPDTTFQEVHELFSLTEDRIINRLAK